MARIDVKPSFAFHFTYLALQAQIWKEIHKIEEKIDHFQMLVLSA